MTISGSGIRRRLGLAMMASSIALGGAAMQLGPAGASAQTGEPQDIEVVKQAIYTTTAGRSTPDTLTSEFPPGFLCVLVPQTCPSEIAPVGDAVAGVTAGVEAGPEEPEPLTPPDSLPVSIVSGVTHYESALQIVVPAVADGQQLDQFVLQLDAIQPTYHSSSPQFRQAILALFASIASRTPEADEFQKALEAAPIDVAPIGIEACPVVTSFVAGNQGEAARPEIDCVFGTNGVYVGDATGQSTGMWEFDLTFAAQAWLEGLLPNEGIFLRPTAAPNLAFGDPDSSTFAQVTFSNAVRGVFETSEASAPVSSVPPASPANPSNTSTAASQPLTTGSAFAPPANVPLEPSVAPGQPEVAPSSDLPVTDNGQLVTAALDLEPATSAWWVWLLVPVFLAGMYLTAQSLTTEVVLAAERRGAMTRLIDLNQGQRGE